MTEKNVMNFELDNNEPVFPIRTAAKLLGISIPTLRMYEKEGLIIPAKTEGNQRQYSQSDLERIKCIRTAIKDSKFSINGIKALCSLIPCWEVVGCTEEDRKNCPSFNGHEEPCWAQNNENTICADKICRECDVYKNYYKCTDIKELIKNISRKKNEIDI